MVSEWQKKYENEARDLIKKEIQEYSNTVRIGNVTTALKRCECGFHTTEEKLRFCKHCKRSFCGEHGDFKNLICHKCDECNGKEKK